MKWKNVDWISVGISVLVIGFSFAITYFGIQSLKANFKIESESQNPIPDSTPVTVQEITEPIICEIGAEESEPVYPLSDYDRWYIECMVAGEAKGESLLGKMAVAQCILNAMIQDGYSPDEVRKEYQYSGWDEDLKSNNLEAYEEVAHAVWCVFDNGEVVTQENILWFYAPKYSKGKFHNTQNFVIEIGNHRFYSPKENKV